jgi:hypothetical protein
MKKNLTLQSFKNGYEFIASSEDDYINYQVKRTEAQNEVKSKNWQIVVDPETDNTDWAVWDNGYYRIISDCGVSSLYKKIKNDEKLRGVKKEA